MTNRPNVLVICGRNKKRSRTAEYIFKNDSRFNIRSAGLSSKSERVITLNDLQWADLVFVMEVNQRAKLYEQFGNGELPPIEVLFIEDAYEFLDEELIDSLEEGINSTLKRLYSM